MIAEAPGETTITSRRRWDDGTPLAPVSHPDADQLNARLEELIGLEANWDGYGANTIDRRAIRQAVSVIKWSMDAGLPVPELFPVPSGGVQLEWTAGSVELEFEIEPDGQSAVFVGDDAVAGRRFDGELPRDQSLFQQAVATLRANLGEHAGG